MLKRVIKRLLADHKPAPLVPKIGVSEILPSEIRVHIIEPDVQDGNVTLAELVILTQLVELRKPATIFEIGTFDGRTTLNLAKNAPGDTQVFTLDLGSKEIEELSKVEHGDRKFMGKIKSGWRFEGKVEAKKITQLWGDSAKFDFAPYKGSIDFLFIDGSHQYDYVLKDSESALKIIKPGAAILWHGYNTSWPGVTQALNELQARNPRFKNIRHISGTSLVYAVM